MIQHNNEYRSPISSTFYQRFNTLLNITARIFSGFILASLIGIGSVTADDSSNEELTDTLPEFFQKSLPKNAIGEILKGYSAVQEGAVLDTRTRELIALGVAAQIPCVYCVYAHRRNAIKAGASDAELREAIAAGAYVRFWSTTFQGAEIDFEAFKKEHDKLRGNGS